MKISKCTYIQYIYNGKLNRFNCIYARDFISIPIFITKDTDDLCKYIVLDDETSFILISYTNYMSKFIDIMCYEVLLLHLFDNSSLAYIILANKVGMSNMIEYTNSNKYLKNKNTIDICMKAYKAIDISGLDDEIAKLKKVEVI